MSAPIPIPEWAHTVAAETFPFYGLEGSRDGLAQRIADAHHRATQSTVCAFCGQAYPPGTPQTQHELLSAHIRVCTKHPMREVEAKLATIQALCQEGEDYGERPLDTLNSVRRAMGMKGI